MTEQEITELEGGLAKLDAKINALTQARDDIRAKLNAGKGNGQVQESSDGIPTILVGAR